MDSRESRPFRASSALLEGHFQLSSGCTPISTSNARCCSRIRSMPVDTRGDRKLRAGRTSATPEIVIRPALGAVVSTQEMARALGARLLHRRADGVMCSARFALKPGGRVLVVEDVLTTGGSKEVLAVVAQGARCVGVATIINHSGQVNPFSADRFRSRRSPKWKRCRRIRACPLCTDAGRRTRDPARQPTEPGSSRWRCAR
jgi:orotate phosphoribosyltransferase